MENNELLATVTEKAKVWLGEGYDQETRTEVKRMLDADDMRNRIWIAVFHFCCLL